MGKANASSNQPMARAVAVLGAACAITGVALRPSTNVLGSAQIEDIAIFGTLSCGLAASLFCPRILFNSIYYPLLFAIASYFVFLQGSQYWFWGMPLGLRSPWVSRWAFYAAILAVLGFLVFLAINYASRNWIHRTAP